MTRPELSFDPECYELAQYFFPAASEKRLNEIAQALQDTVEGFSDELARSPRRVTETPAVRSGLPLCDCTGMTGCKELAEGQFRCKNEEVDPL